MKIQDGVTNIVKNKISTVEQNKEGLNKEIQGKDEAVIPNMADWEQDLRHIKNGRKSRGRGRGGGRGATRTEAGKRKIKMSTNVEDPGQGGEMDLFGFDDLEDRPVVPGTEEHEDSLSRGPRAVSTAGAGIKKGKMKADTTEKEEQTHGVELLSRDVGLFVGNYKRDKETTTYSERGKRPRERPPGKKKVEEDVDTSHTKSLFNASQRAKKMKNLLQYADTSKELNPERKVELQQERRKLVDDLEEVGLPVLGKSEQQYVSPVKSYQVPVIGKIATQMDVAKFPQTPKIEMVEIRCDYCDKIFRSPVLSATEKCYQAHLKQAHQSVNIVQRNSEVKNNTEDGFVLIVNDGKNMKSVPFMCEDCNECFGTRQELERHVFKKHYNTFCEKFL